MIKRCFNGDFQQFRPFLGFIIILKQGCKVKTTYKGMPAHRGTVDMAEIGPKKRIALPYEEESPFYAR